MHLHWQVVFCVAVMLIATWAQDEGDGEGEEETSTGPAATPQSPPAGSPPGPPPVDPPGSPPAGNKQKTYLVIFQIDFIYTSPGSLLILHIKTARTISCLVLTVAASR
jgi:hypothetical protein